MKVLAIDDIQDNLTVLKAVIKDAFPDATVYTALNGPDGIKLASATDPDVILLDIIMPEMDGFEVCRRLKKEENLKHIPVVFLTALKTTAANRIKALEAGGDGFLSKPVNREELMAQLRAMKKIKQAAMHEKEEKRILESMVAERTHALEAEIKLRMETEQQLRESEQRYRLISSLTSDYVFEEDVAADGSRIINWVAGSFKEITGYTQKEFIAQGGWRSILHPADLPVDDDALEKLFQNKKASHEVRIFHKSGRIIWVKVYVYPVWDNANGQLQKIIGSVKDITEEKLNRQVQEILFGIAKKVLTSNRLSDLYREVQQELHKVMDAENFVVARWAPDTQRFYVCYGKDEKETFDWYAAAGSLSYRVIQRQKPLLLTGKEIEAIAAAQEETIPGTIPEVWMGAPLYRNNEIFGVMIVQHYQNAKAYDKLMLRIFEAAANELSFYIGRKETEERNASLSKAIDQSLVGTLITDPGGTIQFVNPSFCQLTGRKKEELIGKDARSLQPELFRKKNLSVEIKEALQQRKVWQNTLSGKKKDGTLFWVEIMISPLVDANNEIIRIVVLLEDKTEPKRNELFQQIQFNIAHSMITSATLHDLFLTVKRELNKVMPANNIFIALYNPQTDSLETELGVDEKEFVPRIPPRKSLSGIVMKTGKTLLFTKKQIRELARKGTIQLVGKRAALWLGAPLVRNDQPIGVIAVQDYHNPKAYDKKALEMMSLLANQLSLYIEQKNAEEFNRKLSKAIEQSPVSIVITDTHGTIEYINPKFTEITGYTWEEAIGKNPNILKSGEHSRSFYQKLWDTVLSGKEWTGELHNKRKNGTLYWENALIAPIFDQKGKITHLLGVKEDITGKKKMLHELIAAKEKAEESDRLKTAFLQNMSHEIRTPLNGILGFADLLTFEDISTEKVREYAGFIVKSGQRLLQLINNILDISRIESGSIPVHFKTFNLNRLLKDLCRPFELQATKKQIAFQCRLPLADEKSLVVSDDDKISQIITNLVNNAIKFTAKGRVEVGYQSKDKELLFWVKDTGRGIAPEHQKRIFERFYQAETSITRDFEGAGLGLPISKGLVELLGGKIWLESEEGKGTTFFFTIPLRTPLKNPEQPVRQVRHLPATEVRPVLLVVEDDETGFLYLKTVLQRENMEVLRATTGKEAVHLCKSHPEISLVLMDIKLPGMNGLEATRQIKAQRPGLPVIAQTAHAFSSDRREALQAGCDDFITKPIRKETLIETVGKYLGHIR